MSQSEEWQADPNLQRRFHPEYPDDLQVLVHDGGPTMTGRAPELMWMRIRKSTNGVFTGQVLNRPHALETVRQGDDILFRVNTGGEYPIRVSRKYLQQRSDWEIGPCSGCDLTEIFDAPSDLIR